MAHVSELCDGFVQDITRLFKVGQEVQARIVNVDTENGKLSLGLKPSYFELGDEDDGDDRDAVMGVAESDDDDDLDQALLLAGARNDSGGSGDSDASETSEDSSDSEEDLDEALLKR